MHIKGDDLAELAIGGTDLDAAGHVADCAKCAAEVEALSDIARRLAEFAPLRVPPPPHVWTAIHAEVTGVEATVVDIEQAREGRQRRTGVVRRLLPLAVAAAVGAVAMWTGLTLAGSPEDTPTMAGSESQLAPLMAGMGPIVCSVTVEGDRVLLDLNVEELPEMDDGYLEVWLLDDAGDRMLPIGLLEGYESNYVLSDNFSPSEFPVVEVTRESYDGDTRHSGDSLWRGPLAQG